MKFSGKNPALRVAAKRCATLSSDRNPKENILKTNDNGKRN
jgi:hypothetical protein